MKVMLVDLEFDYGNPKRGVNGIREFGIEPAFKNLGHEVIKFYYDSLLNDLDQLQKKVLATAAETKPDLIFFILFRDQFKMETLLELKSKYKTMNWFGDDTWRFDSFSKNYANAFTYCVTTDKFSISKYKAIDQKNIILSQWAAFEKANTSEFQGKYKYDISFIGAKNSFRAWFIQQLEAKGIKVDCFGHGWSNGMITNDEMNIIFRHSKINLNLSNSNNSDVNYIFSSPINFARFLKTKKNSEQIKARNFEIPFAGGFQLTNYVATIEDYFYIGKEIACYTSLDEVYKQIKYYLENEDDREQIRLLGQNKARSQHGYTHRFKEIMEYIK